MTPISVSESATTRSPRSTRPAVRDARQQGRPQQRLSRAVGHGVRRRRRLPAPGHPERRLDPRVANDVTMTLKPVAKYSGDALANGRASAAKTGTVGIGTKTTNNSDAWMVGFTPQVSAAVWVGTGYRQADLQRRRLPDVRLGPARQDVEAVHGHLPQGPGRAEAAGHATDRRGRHGAEAEPYGHADPTSSAPTSSDPAQPSYSPPTPAAVARPPRRHRRPTPRPAFVGRWPEWAHPHLEPAVTCVLRTGRLRIAARPAVTLRADVVETRMPG